MARDDGAAKVTVWFDGGCPLCRREIALMRRLDRRGAISFIDLSAIDLSAIDLADGASEGSCPIDRADLLARFHAREDGRLVSGAEAFAAMWRAIPMLRPFGLLARRPQVLAVFEGLYRRYLRVRPRFQAMASRLEQAGTAGQTQVSRP